MASAGFPEECHERRGRGSRRLAGFAACLLAVLVGCGSVSTGGDGDGAGSDGGSDGENDPPTDIALSASEVEEQALPGTRVGVLSAVDPDSGDSHTFELVADGGGMFVIAGDELRVAPDARLDHETAATVAVTVQAIDAGGLGIERDVEISILDLREVANTNNSGEGSLRRAIADAEPGETILFETGLGSPILIDSVLLLTKNVTIRGPLPPAEIVIDAQGTSRVFDVSPAATVTLQHLRIRGGQSTTAGAILNEGVLTVERCIFEDNLAGSFGRGGAIASQNQLTVRDSLFDRNRGFNGGAIAADGEAGTSVERCTFKLNETTGGSGAAIVGGWLTISNSTFAGNSARDLADSTPVGGAVALFYADSEIAFTTFEDNGADGEAGAIYCSGGAGELTFTLRSSIVAHNTAPVGVDIQIRTGCTIVADHTVVTSVNGTGFNHGEDGNVLAAELSYATGLGDHGGFTPTIVPVASAVSVDRVPAESCTGVDGNPLASDQRGEARPAGEACDAGSVEQ
jgi:hypothetical protein